MGFAIGTTAWRETNRDRWRLFEKMSWRPAGSGQPALQLAMWADRLAAGTTDRWYNVWDQR
jgi:hypothetical protein